MRPRDSIWFLTDVHLSPCPLIHESWIPTPTDLACQLTDPGTQHRIRNAAGSRHSLKSVETWIKKATHGCVQTVHRWLGVPWPLRTDAACCIISWRFGCEVGLSWSVKSFWLARLRESSLHRASYTRTQGCTVTSEWKLPASGPEADFWVETWAADRGAGLWDQQSCDGEMRVHPTHTDNQ